MSNYLASLLTFHGLIYPPPSSVFVTVMTLFNSLLLLGAGFNLYKGNVDDKVQYSKLVNPTSSGKRIPSKLGMLVFYTPSFLISLLSFFLFPITTAKFILLRTILTLHFLKRTLEVLFLHKYSGMMDREAAIIVPINYFITTLTIIYTQHLSTTTMSLQYPVIDLKYVGVGLFLVGIVANFYHHCILASLRKEGEKGYKIPEGGLFGVVICPHYLFEVIEFWGIACVAQTLYALSFTLNVTVYLMGRSHATRKWYASKFDDFPTRIKCMVPFVF